MTLKMKNNNISSNDLNNNFIYQVVSMIANFMDKMFLDPMMGFVFPAFGDALMSVLVIPYLYISIFKVKSLSLTLAIILNTLIDIMIGIIPFGIGDVLDIFHRSYSKNLKLINGFVAHDEEVIKEINKKMWIIVILIIVVSIIIFMLFKLAFSLITGGIDLLSSLFA